METNQTKTLESSVVLNFSYLCSKNTSRLYAV